MSDVVYEVVGPKAVAGFEPGDTFQAADAKGLNLDALVQGGHIQPKAVKPSGKTDDTKEQ